MQQTDLRGWRELSLDDLRQALAAIVLGGVVFISATRLTLLPGDILVANDFSGEGNVLRQLLYLVGVGLMLVTADPLRQPARLLAVPVSVLILLAWCVASLGWSVAPGVGLRRLVLAVLVIWMCFRSVDMLGPRRALAVVLYVSLGLLVANLVAVATVPVAVHRFRGVILDDSIVGAWRGIMPEKNGAGLLTAVTIILLCFGVGRLPLLVRIGCIGLAAIFLYGTQSKTAIGLVGIGIVTGGLYQLYTPQWRVFLLPLLAIGGAAAVLAAWTYVPPYLLELDSSLAAFTGRIQIWRVMVDYIADNPWLGAGFGSVWNVGPTSPVYRYTTSHWITTMIAEGHNGYLDLVMQIGIPGAVLAIGVLFVLPLAKLLTLPAAARDLAGVCLGVLIFSLFHNLTESTILWPDHFGQVMIVIAVAVTNRLCGSWWRPGQVVTGRSDIHRPPVRADRTELA
ncbi:O-antigen ligase family protein [Croceibacterium ferulae]|uniref:O-antigen ligase family protein n=1 Tax=Croceibacterium ferulae TaxID=1854641 RepID=UPI000EAFDCA0|nr:O-antigen ligase family protein [Croceibacterium ferulae]